MYMTPRRSTVPLVATASLCLLGVAHGQTVAQSRAGQFDSYFTFGYIGGDSGTLSGRNVHFDLDGVWGWGFGVGYHFTDEWSVLMDLVFANTDLALSSSSNPAAGTYRQSADYFNGRVNVEYTPRPGPVSPVLTAGIGWNNFHTVIPGAAPQVYCGPSYYTLYWWCTSGVPSYDQTAFAGNIGAGVRWDPSASMFLKLMYTSTWVDYSGVSGTRQFNQVMLQIGAKFL
jgi:opacity protein-like surface antigen